MVEESVAGVELWFQPDEANQGMLAGHDLVNMERRYEDLRNLVHNWENARELPGPEEVSDFSWCANGRG